MVCQEIAVRGKTTDSPAAFDLASAKTTFESTCNGCHPLSNVASSPPKSEAEGRVLGVRMVENSLFRDDKMLEQIVGYLARAYGR